MATKLMYLDDFGVVTCEAKVVEINDIADERADIVLDVTCFYPRGGGQDWDTGTISKSDGARFQVEEVRLDEGGVVHHIGRFVTGEFVTGTSVKCDVNIERRDINTKLHSAGHVIDLAVDKLGFSWLPGRAGHYPHMSFVEYESNVAPEEYDSLRHQIQETVQKVIDNSSSENEIRFMPVSEMHTICRHVPDNIPTNKPARVVVYNEDFGVPCGGTHVKKLSEIGKVTITKIKSKKGVTKVSYTVEGVN